ncbi:hypothetical protein ACLBOM_08750 [Escherichia coli]
MSTLHRKQCLKQLWENSSMPSDVYQQFCLMPVETPDGGAERSRRQRWGGGPMPAVLAT